jgi:hypothetical protein
VFSNLADQRPTHGQRLDSYKRREEMTVWVGAGLAALVILLSGDLAATAGGDGVPALLVASALTAALAGAGCLAMARVGFEWSATELRRAASERGDSPDEKLRGKDAAWPVLPEIMWRGSLILLPVATLIFLASIWWTAV